MSFGVFLYLICVSRFDRLVENSFLFRVGEEQLQVLNVNLTSENSRLRDRVAVLERAAQIDRIAYKEINTTVESVQDKIRETKEELLFYQGLVASSEQGKNFKIQSLKLWPGDTERSYHYRIVLTRFRRDDKVTRGALDLSVFGQREGQPDHQALSDMVVEATEKLAFNFKNFHKIEGFFVLPTGFTPHRLIAKVDLRGKDTNQITKTVDWAGAMD